MAPPHGRHTWNISKQIINLVNAWVYSTSLGNPNPSKDVWILLLLSSKYRVLLFFFWGITAQIIILNDYIIYTIPCHSSRYYPIQFIFLFNVEHLGRIQDGGENRESEILSSAISKTTWRHGNYIWVILIHFSQINNC
jgi:hypothetical protein